MAKVDYAAHQAAFLERRKNEKSLTVKEYCDEVGLKYASAKRYIKSAKSRPLVKVKEDTLPVKKRTESWEKLHKEYLEEAIIHPELSQKDFANRKQINQNSLRRAFSKLRNEGDQKELVAQWEASVIKYSEQLRDESEKAKEAEKTRIYNVAKGNLGKGLVVECDHEVITDHDNDQPTSKRPFNRSHFLTALTPGGTFNIKHGGFSKLFRANSKVKKIVDGLEPDNIAYELHVARTQYFGIAHHRDELLKDLERRYQAGEEIKDHEGKPSTYLKEKSKLLVAYSGRMRELEGSIQCMVGLIHNTEIAKAKLIVSASKMPAVEPEKELELLNEALEARVDQDWDAMTTVKYIEAKGIKVPPFLLTEARKELELLEPEVDDNGITNEEAERRAKLYMESQRSMARELNQRRKDVQDAFEEAEYEEANSNTQEEDDENYDHLDKPGASGDLFSDLDKDDLTPFS